MNESYKEELKQKLIDMPQKIFDKEIELVKKIEDLYEFSLINSLTEQNTKTDIVKATTSDGKNLFTNEAQRKSELTKRLSQNPEYSSRSDKIKGLKSEIENDKIIIGFLKRKLNATISIVDLEKI